MRNYRKNWYLRSILTFMGVCIFLLRLQAQSDSRGPTPLNIEDNPSGNVYALILGISDYPHLPKLRFADDDAILFKNFLTSEAGGKVPEKNMALYERKWVVLGKS